MTAAAFRASLTDAAPPQGISAPLAALWWAAKGDWDKAHGIAQDDASTGASWVHAYLHRVEGDLGNAAYWYRRAGQPVATDTLEAEWERIAAALLEDDATPSTLTKMRLRNGREPGLIGHRRPCGR